jgi:ABC-type multidrug transport system fused ATPase/permease subunit
MFKEGTLVEQGTHEELVKIEEGEYRRLWEVQAQGFV